MASKAMVRILRYERTMLESFMLLTAKVLALLPLLLLLLLLLPPQHPTSLLGLASTDAVS